LDARAADTAIVPGGDAQRVIRLLSEISRMLVSALPLAEVLSRVVDLLITHLNCERACLLLYDPQTGELVPRVTRRGDGRPSGDIVISRTLLKLVLADRAAILTCDVAQDGRLGSAASLIITDVRSLICGPLITKDEIVGVLYVDNHWQQRFTE